MVQGMYTAVSGMIPRINQVRNVANNIANQTTHGYKKSSIFLRALITAQYALDHASGIERTKISGLISHREHSKKRTGLMILL